MEKYERLTKRMKTWGWTIHQYEKTPICSYCGNEAKATLKIFHGMLGKRQICNDCLVKIINKFESL